MWYLSCWHCYYLRAVFTADALNCQREIAAKVVERGGDYVLALKGNQGNLHDDVRLFLDDKQRPAKAPIAPSMATMAASKPASAWSPPASATARGSCLARPGGHRSNRPDPRGRRHRQYRDAYDVLSPRRFAQVARVHWTVENSLHWVLDFTMNEDQTRNRLDNGPANPALPRRMAANLAKFEASRGSTQGKLKKVGWNDSFLASLLAQFGNTQTR